MRGGTSGCHAERVSLRCLIVDDNHAFLDAARALLEREGLDVVGVASTSAQPLDCAERLGPDVVLVDVMLGEESGIGLARRLDGGGATVVMISTHSEADVSDLVAGSGAAGFVPKSDLSAGAIRELLGGAPEARM
jgi:two-component system, NarL family, nitrate/nitrite response regulator NarL